MEVGCKCPKTLTSCCGRNGEQMTTDADLELARTIAKGLTYHISGTDWHWNAVGAASDILAALAKRDAERAIEHDAEFYEYIRLELNMSDLSSLNKLGSIGWHIVAVIDDKVTKSIRYALLERKYVNRCE
jgi:hypothetical protein